jgi:putative restriction endonuclease
MVRLRKPALLDVITDAVHSSGWNIVYLSDQHPFLLRLYSGTESLLCRVYIWNLTHGGGANRPADEYRIQITGIDNAVGFVADGADRVLVLGWWVPVGVFAGFDPRKHPAPLGSSPSIQIREQALRQAAVNGFGTHVKDNAEIAVAFKPALFVEYARDQLALHGFGESPQDQVVLEEVVEDPSDVPPSLVEQVASERQTVIVSLARKLRDSSFQERVLTAYSRRCAMCSIQLKLVDAAHIVPVSENGSDATNNGIALCALHHRAFDRGLVTVDPEYRVIVNRSRLAELAQLNLEGGRKQFVENLRPIIHLPPSILDRPDAALIQHANQLRGWIS